MSAKEDAQAILTATDKGISAAMSDASKLSSFYESAYLGTSVRDSALIKRKMREKVERGMKG